QRQLSVLDVLYRDWNDKINVISRKDIDNLYEHHVLHSLAIAKYNPFSPGMKVLDAGTGGGFPGIPIAIMYPEVQFTLLDATAKKLKVVKHVAEAIGLTNVTTIHARVEDFKGSFDIVSCRAVTTLLQLIEWTKHLMRNPRWVVLKGGTTEALLQELPPAYRMAYKMTCIPISEYFEEEYFVEKYVFDIVK